MREEKARNKWCTASKLIALLVLLVDGSATYIVLYLCWLSIQLQFEGGLPYLTTLIGALQAATAVVLSAYFKKSKAENVKGGIIYAAAMGGADPGPEDGSPPAGSKGDRQPLHGDPL